MNKPRARRDDLPHHFLLLACRYGWDGVTPARLAKASGQKLRKAEDFLHSPAQMLSEITAHITRRTLQDYRPENGTTRDALFDILMRRFDVLQDYRAGLLSLAAAARRQPALGAALLRALQPALPEMLQAAGLTPKPWQRVGLGLIYAATLKVWQDDESADLSRTMAALDRHLRRTEALLGKLLPQTDAA